MNASQLMMTPLDDIEACKLMRPRNASGALSQSYCSVLWRVRGQTNSIRSTLCLDREDEMAKYIALRLLCASEA